MARKPDKKQYAVLDKYMSLIKEYPRASEFEVGQFYSFFYYFTKDKNQNIIRYYDRWPLMFFFGASEKIPNLVYGLNFHHLPITVRSLFLKRIQALVTEDFDSDSRLTRLANWRSLFNTYRKAASFSVRQYYLDQMREIRQIPNTKMAEMLKYYAKTHYSINIASIEKRYNIFRVT